MILRILLALLFIYGAYRLQTEANRLSREGTSMPELGSATKPLPPQKKAGRKKPHEPPFNVKLDPKEEQDVRNFFEDLAKEEETTRAGQSTPPIDAADFFGPDPGIALSTPEKVAKQEQSHLLNKAAIGLFFAGGLLLLIDAGPWLLRFIRRTRTPAPTLEVTK